MKSLGAWFCFVSMTLFWFGCNEKGEPKAIDDFTSRHGIVRKTESSILDGPYAVQKVVSLTNLVVKTPQTSEMNVICRGIEMTPDVNLTQKAVERLRVWLRHEEVYTHTNTTRRLSSNRISAVLSKPTTRVCIGRDPAHDKLSYEVQDWIVIQIELLLMGVASVDASDTNHVYYQTFLEAENLAKKYRKGYWATHTEPPPRTATNAVSNVTTNK